MCHTQLPQGHSDQTQGQKPQGQSDQTQGQFDQATLLLPPS